MSTLCFYKPICTIKSIVKKDAGFETNCLIYFQCSNKMGLHDITNKPWHIW